ncbi:CVNH domain-containing protein [Xylariomycetidae sp. FL0641]|nr:CVNH domain-containing protein [Xylariomycetidae sp. FL0641]
MQTFVALLSLAANTVAAATITTTATDAASTGVPPPPTGLERSFVDTCDRWEIVQQGTNPWLLAYCHAEDGRLWHSVLNLNHCLALINGDLVAGNEGNAGQSCYNGQIYNDIDKVANAGFECHTGDPNQDVRWQMIVLNDYIHNDNGALFCFGHTGCPVGRPECTDKPSGA